MVLFIILVTIIYFVIFLLTLSLNYFVNVDLLLLNSEPRFMIDDIGSQVSSSSNTSTTTSSTNPSPTTSSTNPSSTSHGYITGHGIMPTAIPVGGAGMVVGMKAAAASPTLAGKLGWGAVGVLVGGASIITASIAQNIGEGIVNSP